MRVYYIYIYVYISRRYNFVARKKDSYPPYLILTRVRTFRYTRTRTFTRARKLRLIGNHRTSSQRSAHKFSHYSLNRVIFHFFTFLSRSFPPADRWYPVNNKDRDYLFSCACVLRICLIVCACVCLRVCIIYYNINKNNK